jgi:hypothetical protein
MIKFVKIFWILSLLLLTGAMLLAYSYLPLQVVIGEDERGIANYIIEREQFFYYGFIGCVLFNGLLLLLGGLIVGLPKALLPIPKREIWAHSHVTRREMRVRLKNWLKGFGLAFNMYAMITIASIYDLNDADVRYSLEAWNVVIPAFLLIWLALYFFLFSSTKTLEEHVS